MSASPLHRFPWGLALLSLLALTLGLYLTWLGWEELHRGNRLAFLFVAVHYAVAIYGAFEIQRTRVGKDTLLSGSLPHLTIALFLTVLLCVPTFLRARKRAASTQMKSDLRLLDAAWAQYAIEFPPNAVPAAQPTPMRTKP